MERRGRGEGGGRGRREGGRRKGGGREGEREGGRERGRERGREDETQQNSIKEVVELDSTLYVDTLNHANLLGSLQEVTS